MPPQGLVLFSWWTLPPVLSLSRPLPQAPQREPGTEQLPEMSAALMCLHLTSLYSQQDQRAGPVGSPCLVPLLVRPRPCMGRLAAGPACDAYLWPSPVFLLSVPSALGPLSIHQGPSVGRPKTGLRRMRPKVGFAFDSEQVGLSYDRIS